MPRALVLRALPGALVLRALACASLVPGALVPRALACASLVPYAFASCRDHRPPSRPARAHRPPPSPHPGPPAAVSHPT
ncbi:hypothetical protein [Streptomyces sp. enrichment culture]|uniref:hypothetical protein n=1 Tax=Streptomyces sp. enrichment culture TaxID=1795815 RepID=UPI003F54C3E2